MTILLLGKDGQVGWELQRSLSVLAPLTAFSRQEADLEDLEGLSRLVSTVRPRVIVNAAAYTAVDKAESDTARAMRINAEAVGVLAQEAAKIDAWLVHYSTDYVFDGTKNSPYREDDQPNPLSVYGRSKRDGEHAIQAALTRHLIFRTSWVFAARKNNFAKTMLRLAADRDALNVVADQIGAPTSAELIADVTAIAVHRLLTDPQADALSGLYNLAAAGQTSWCDYARFVLRQAEALGTALKVTADQVGAIPTSAYPTPARRPANSRLDIGKVQAAFNVVLPQWQNHVARMISELLEEKIV